MSVYAILQYAQLHIDIAHIVCSRVYVTVWRPSLCPSVCPVYRPLQQRAAGLLLSARQAGDIGRQRRAPGAQQHGIRQQMRAMSRWQEVEHKLVAGMHFGIVRSVRLSVPRRSCLDYRHAGCLQLSHRRPPEMCGLRTRPRTDVDPPRFLCHRRTAIGGGGYIISPPQGR